MTRLFSKEQRELLQKALDMAYEKYPDEWLRTFEQGKYRPPWYKRLWRRFFPQPAVLTGFGADPKSAQK